MWNHHKITVITLLVFITLFSAANLGITIIGTANLVNQPEPIQNIPADQNNPVLGVNSKTKGKNLLVEIPARPDLLMKDYPVNYTIDKALRDIQFELGGLGDANGAYDISIMKGDGVGSVVVRESSCGGDACGLRQSAYRNGVPQLTVNYGSYASSIALEADGKKYVIQPVYDTSCSTSSTPGNGVNLLGITFTEGNIISSYNLPEALNMPCFFNAPNGEYDNPYINLTSLYSDWGHFGANLEISDVKVQVNFSDEVTTQTGTWK